MNKKIKPLYKDLAFYIALFLLFFSFCVIGIGLQRIGSFIDIPILFIVLLPTIGYLLIAFGAKSFKTSLSIAVIGRAESEGQVVEAVSFYACAWTAILICGFIALLIGFINTLAGGVEFDKFFYSVMAMCLGTVLYALFFGAFFIAFKYRCKMLLEQYREEGNEI